MGDRAGGTISGEVFVHMLCVLVLPYSNWQWATVCLAESMMALRQGAASPVQLGRVPRYHQTDNSTASRSPSSRWTSTALKVQPLPLLKVQPLPLLKSGPFPSSRCNPGEPFSKLALDLYRSSKERPLPPSTDVSP